MAESHDGGSRNPLKPNRSVSTKMQDVILKVDAFAYRGKAVAAMPSGKRCFIRGGAPGDVLAVEIVKEKKSYAEGVIREILTPSPNRIRPVCPYAGECPGCSYAHVGYATELEWKQKQFERFLVHPGLVDPAAMRKPVPADRRTGWRNKIRLTVEKSGETVRTGYRMEDNRTVLDIRNCLLACPEIARMMEKKLGDEDFRSHLPEGTSFLTFRYTPADGAILLEEEGVELKRKWLTDTIPAFGDFSVPRASFFQINPGMASRLGEEFLRIVRKVEPELFLELYCGCGVFSALAAEAGVERIFGVEIDSESVRAASRNLRSRGLPRCRFLAGDAVRMLDQLPLHPERRSLLLVDPPRTGLERRVIETIGKSSVRDLVYVSCGPDTLARDLALFRNQGWTVVETGLFDFFPTTAHFESLTYLKRGEPA